MMQRKRKVQKGYRPSRSLIKKPEICVPRLVLDGHWLGDAGFIPGAVAIIQSEPGRITLTLDKGGSHE